MGHRHIHGELTKLAIAVSPSTALEIPRAAGIDPPPRRAGSTPARGSGTNLTFGRERSADVR